MDVHSAASVAAPPRALSVERCSLHERRRLLDDYILASRPVVIPDASAQWRARQRWSPKFFRRHYGSVAATVGGQVWTIAEYVARMEQPAGDEPLPYPFNFDMLAHFPELVADVEPQPRFGEIDRLRHPLLWKRLLRGTRPHELFFGGSGSCFRTLHFDTLYLHGHVTQILGEKEFFLYPPEQTPLMYPSAANPKLSAIDDPLQPDLLRFPRFAQARPHRTVVAPGETIFFPAGWWHFTRMLGPSISYGGVGLTSANWPGFIRDNYAYRVQSGVPRWKAAALLGYGTLAGEAMDWHESVVRLLRSPPPSPDAARGSF